MHKAQSQFKNNNSGLSTLEWYFNRVLPSFESVMIALLIAIVSSLIVNCPTGQEKQAVKQAADEQTS